MESFLRQTAKAILQEHGWEQLRQTTLVLPSRRAGLVLRDELLQLQKAEGRRVAYAPQVQTLNQFLDSLSPLYAEDELTTIVRLYRLYLQSEGQNDPLPLDLFYGWGRQMLADFTNIDASMPAEEVAAFFSNTIAAHELSQWELDEEVENRLRALVSPTSGNLTADELSIRAQYDHLWQSMAHIYAALREEMRAEQKGYSGLRSRSVVEEWDTILQSIAGRHFVFVGFNYLLPVERQVMQLLKDAGQATFYWDYIREFQTNRKAFSFTQINQSLLGNSLAERAWGETRDVDLMACTSPAAQAQYVNEWLREHYTQKGQRVAVVICDENLLEPVIYALPAITLPGEDQPAPVNITKGFPLRSTRPFALVLREADKWTDTIDLEALLQAITPEVTENEEDQEPQAKRWQQLLYEEAIFQVRKCIYQLRKVVETGIEGVGFTPKLVRMLLRRQMEAVTMPFHGEPVTDLQVLGVLETRMLDFDAVLLLNMEEGIMPQRQNDNSFIPFYLRKSYHMQTSDERATVYAYNFFRLLSRAGHVTLLYTPAETNGNSKGLSRFVLQMEASPEFRLHRYRLQESDRLQTGDLVGEMDDSYTRNSLSPSAINTYIQCPRRFYYRYVRNLQPTEKEEALFAPNVVGSFVHTMLETIYTDYCGCTNQKPVTVTAVQIEAVLQSPDTMRAALDKTYAKQNTLWLKDHSTANESEHYKREEHSIENQAIERYVKYVLERDKVDAEREGLQIWLLEQNRSLTLPIEGVGTMTTGGIIDRLDIIGKGDQARIRIVDYKSGSYKAEKMNCKWDDLTTDEKKAYVLQTLIYSAAVDDFIANHAAMKPYRALPLQPNLFFCQKPLIEQETRVMVEETFVDDYRQIRDTFIPQLAAKVKEIRTATVFPQQMNTEECSAYCPFADLCGRKVQSF